MSTVQDPDPDAKRDENLEELYRVSDELKRIADSDARYSEYAENFLASLREVGYDV